jgi:plastocyanin
MKKHLAFLVAVLLIGGGCLGGEQETPESTPAVSDDLLATAPATITVGEPTGSQPTTVEVIEVAATDKPMAVESAPSVPKPKTIQMKSGNFFFDPAEITAEPGQEITIHFTENAGFHTFVIDAINLVKKVEADGKVTFTAPTEPGSYEFYCNIGSHQAKGMTGLLKISL